MDGYIVVRDDESRMPVVCKRSDSLPSAIGVRVAVAMPPDALMYGFGSGDEMLDAARRVRPDVITWVADDKDPAHVVVRRFSPLIEVPRVPDTVFDVDLAQGWMITKVIANNRQGQVGVVREVAVRQTESGEDRLWFPSEVKETTYLSWLNPLSKPFLKGTADATAHGIASTLTFTIQDLSTTGVEERFGFDSIGLVDGSRVVFMEGAKYFFGVISSNEVIVDRNKEVPRPRPASDDEGSQSKFPLPPISIEADGASMTSPPLSDSRLWRWAGIAGCGILIVITLWANRKQTQFLRSAL